MFFIYFKEFLLLSKSLSGNQSLTLYRDGQYWVDVKIGDVVHLGIKEFNPVKVWQLIINVIVV